MRFLSFDYTNLNLTGVIVFITTFLIGIKFPDWDFKMKLRHRNVLTHSPFILVLFNMAYMRNPNTEFRYFIMGFSLGIGIHLVFDIFPKGWGGGALLQMPFIKYSFRKRHSQLLMLIFIVISFGMAIKNTKFIEEVILLLLFGSTMVILNMIKEEKIVRPMGLYLVLMTSIASIKYKEVSSFVEVVYTTLQKSLINLL